jgi:tRNA modification GTPase
VLREHIQIDGMPLHIVDTAGLRESGDAVEQEGIRRAWTEMASADRILLVVDGTQVSDTALTADSIWPERQEHLDSAIPVTIVINKCDLTKHKSALEREGDNSLIHLSARSGEGIDLLREHLKTCMGYGGAGEGRFSARRRHLDALERAAGFLEAGQLQLVEAGAGELLAEDLRQCQQCLGEITGAVTSDDLLGEIFSSFCIGK